MKRVLIPLATGFEEIEALAVVDILRRAGAEVVLAGLIAGPVTGRNEIRVLPDKGLDEALREKFDMIVLPGGAGGTKRLREDKRIIKTLQEFAAEGEIIAAICAAPTVLSVAGLTEGRRMTSHPGVRAKLKDAILSNERVVADGNIITSQGPGTAIEFAFSLVSILFGDEKAKEVNSGVLARL